MGDEKNANLHRDSSKRLFLKLVAASALGAGIAGATGRTAFAAKVHMPPLPEKVVTRIDC
jgi:carbonic anhydrase